MSADLNPYLEFRAGLAARRLAIGLSENSRRGSHELAGGKSRAEFSCLVEFRRDDRQRVGASCVVTIERRNQGDREGSEGVCKVFFGHSGSLRRKPFTKRNRG